MIKLLRKINLKSLLSFSFFTILSFFAAALIFNFPPPAVHGQTANAWNLHRSGTDLNFYYGIGGTNALVLNSNGQMNARRINDIDNPTTYFLDPSGATNLNSLGINNSVPAAQLHIGSGVANSQALIRFTSCQTTGCGGSRTWQAGVSNDQGSNSQFAFRIEDVSSSVPGVRMIYDSDGTGIKMGIGTYSPQHKLDVRGVLGVNGGTLYGVNNVLLPGALNIGDYNRNYGGSTAQWGSSTGVAGILMEALDNTEIAVHDRDTRIASLLYYEGAGANRITIGRSMGWDTVSTVSIGAPLGYKFGVSGLSYNNSVGIVSSDAVGPGLTISNTGAGGHAYSLLSGGASAGVGLGGFGIFDNSAGAYRLAIKADGNVGIGVLSPTSKLDIITSGVPGLDITAVGGSAPVFNVYKDTPKGASTLAFTVLRSGDVGIGNSSPTSTLDIGSGGGNVLKVFTNNSNAAGVTNYIRGASNHLVLNANGALYLNYPDSANQSETRIGEALFIKRQANVGVGIANPQARLSVLGANNTTDAFRVYNSAQNYWATIYADAAGNGYFQTNFGHCALGTNGQLNCSGGISDKRLKENIRPTAKGLQDLLNIEISDYNLKKRPGHTQTGFIAQQLEPIFPDAVTTLPDPNNPGKSDYVVEYGRITPLIVKSVQDLNQQVESQKTEIEELKREIQELKSVVQKK